ncbi:hypothetical protein D7U77_09500 [Stenotrophomonas maltophilia]|nr:hypothetical protein [Stenotrophomonas maltophilia]
MHWRLLAQHFCTYLQLANESLQLCSRIVDNRKVINCLTNDSTKIGGDFSTALGFASQLINTRQILID